MVTEGALLSGGWERCFIADEPRLSEAIETYQDLGFEVTAVPVPAGEDGCTECMRAQPDRFRLIYIRRK